MDGTYGSRVEALTAELEMLWPRGNPHMEVFDTSNRADDWWPECAVVVDSIRPAFDIHAGLQRVVYPVPDGWCSFRWFLHISTGQRSQFRLPMRLTIADEPAAIRVLETCLEDIRALQQEYRDRAARDGLSLRQLPAFMNDSFVDLEVSAEFIVDGLSESHRLD